MSEQANERHVRPQGSESICSTNQQTVTQAGGGTSDGRSRIRTDAWRLRSPQRRSYLMRSRAWYI